MVPTGWFMVQSNLYLKQYRKLNPLRSSSKRQINRWLTRSKFQEQTLENPRRCGSSDSYPRTPSGRLFLVLFLNKTVQKQLHVDFVCGVSLKRVLRVGLT